MRSNSYKSEVKTGCDLDKILPPKTYNLSPRIVVVAPTNGWGSLPVVRCTLHNNPERWVEGGGALEGGILAPPADRGPATAGERPAEAGPVLLGVIKSFVSSSSVSVLPDVLAKLPWLSFISGFEPPTCIWSDGIEVVESIVLVRLPP
jgi:hypothetical protein